MCDHTHRASHLLLHTHPDLSVTGVPNGTLSLFVTRRRTNRSWCYSTMDMGVAFIADPDRSTANLCLMVQSD
jgi:hypothetical protein